MHRVRIKLSETKELLAIQKRIENSQTAIAFSENLAELRFHSNQYLNCLYDLGHLRGDMKYAITFRDFLKGKNLDNEIIGSGEQTKNSHFQMPFEQLVKTVLSEAMK